MTTSSQNPKIRTNLEIRSESYEGKDILILTCPYGISPEPLALLSIAESILSSFDGTRTEDEIYLQFVPHGVSKEVIDELLSLLKKNFFLENEEYFQKEKELKAEYFKKPTRESSHEGFIFEKSKPLLEKQIDEFLSVNTDKQSKDPSKLLCLVSPHIDYKRGGTCYGKAYSMLKGANHDLYVLIGTSHKYSPHLFHLTKKHFENPLGTLSCNETLVESLASSYGFERSFADEFLHKSEHSLELQIPFMLRTLSNPSMIPILIGGFYHLLRSKILPQQFEPYESFVSGMIESLKSWREQGKTFCFIAGVDMAHVGKQFGDVESLSQDKMEEVRRRDAIYMDAILKRDKLLLWNHIAEDYDARRMCGFPTMYLILDLLERLGVATTGELFSYDQSVSYENECAVSFAGLGLYG